MKSIKPLAYALFGIATLAATLSSCQDEEFGYTAEQIAYESNFRKAFGNLSNIPTFDLSTYNLNRLGLEGGPSNAYGTRATQFSVVNGIGDPFFYVPPMLQDWLDKNIPEDNDNRNNKDSNGQNIGTFDFQFLMPNHDILIIPVYQGQAGMVWDLKLSQDPNHVASNSDKIIWQKSDYLEIAEPEGTDIQYLNEQVGQKKTITINNFGTSRDEDNNSFYSLNSALTEMGFDRQNEWLKIEISGLASGGNGTIRCDKGDDKSLNNIGKINYNENTSNNKVVFNVKKETVLTNSNIEFAQWWPKDNVSPNITIEITRYKKTSKWTKVNEISGENNRKTIEKITRTKAIKITPDDVPSGVFSLYLNITNLDGIWSGSKKWRDNYADREDMWSCKNQMIALNVINDPIIGQDLIYQLTKAYGDAYDYENLFILGCEDSNVSRVDWDMNDAVFLIVGMTEDDIIPATDEVIKKRYMIEDLGSTFDFDFNDMVVDVTQVKHTEGGNTTTKNYATLKHLCGTIPFKIKIGNRTFGPYAGNNGGCEQGGDGYNPANDNTYSDFMNAEFTGWDPETNNIIVTSWPESAGMSADAVANAKEYADSGDNDADKYLGILGQGHTFAFPTEGEYPYIIACDQTVQWMKELITIPTNWFTVNPKNENPQYGTGDVPTPEPTVITLWDTGLTTGASNSHSKIEIDTNKLAEGKTLKIYFDGSNGKWINIHYGKDSWTAVAGYTGNPRTKVLTQTDVTSITNNGLYVQGNETTVTKVTIE